MIDRRATMVVAVLVVASTSAGWATWSAFGQTPPAATSARFEFLVVESFDARYFQDTPGHRGRAASGRVVPRVALNDPVLRGSTRVGTVTHLDWNEARESLDVEFNPEPGVRICVGDPIWIPIPPEKQ